MYKPIQYQPAPAYGQGYLPYVHSRTDSPRSEYFPTWQHAGLDESLHAQEDPVSQAFKVIQDQQAKEAGAGSIESVFQNRIDLVRSKIELIVVQIQQREQINTRVLGHIDYDACQAQSLLLSLAPDQYHQGPDRLNLERMKLDLERQKRMEQVSFFRDLGMLNRDLREALIEYLGERQKASLLGNTEEPK